jgi:hypothetical protein
MAGAPNPYVRHFSVRDKGAAFAEASATAIQFPIRRRLVTECRRYFAATSVAARGAMAATRAARPLPFADDAGA